MFAGTFPQRIKHDWGFHLSTTNADSIETGNDTLIRR